MSNSRVIDRDLLDQLSAEAKASTRGRKNFNFHASEHDTCNRLLNAIEPGSYVPPHCHADARKDESIYIVRGRLGCIFFDPRGVITEVAVLTPGGEQVGINIPHGSFHTVLALEPDTVFFEAKAGPYLPPTDDERAQWAPREGAPESADYLATLQKLFV